MPLQAVIFLAVAAQVRHLRSGRRRHFAAVVGWIAAGLICGEKAIAVPLLLYAITAGFLTGQRGFGARVPGRGPPVLGTVGLLDPGELRRAGPAGCERRADRVPVVPESAAAMGVLVGGARLSLPVRSGLHAGYLPVPGPPSGLLFTVPGGQRLCVGDAEAGTLGALPGGAVP
ncbi:MAG: hypothetical protein ACYCO9_02970 [Streptosporangiaceae bacterium]